MKSLVYILFIITVIWFSSCEKYLSERHTSSVSNISSLKDMQMLMDNLSLINRGSYCALVETATDDFFLGKGGFDRLTDFEKALYLWQDKPLYTTQYLQAHWRNAFHVIAISNTILDELPNVKENDGLSRQTIEGTALFHRAFTYLGLVHAYCNAYDPVSANTDLGLPMRMDSDINMPSKRSSLEETYILIEKDIIKAIELLPETSEFPTRPNKVAAYALMSRLMLTMENYDKALVFANLALSKHNTLLDYNELNPSLAATIPSFNKETIFYAFATGANMLISTRESYVDTVLYASYDEDDLRKEIFFKSENNGYYSFKGSYIGSSGGAAFFIGLTVSELYLIQAEVLARLNRIEESLQSLNRLLEHRFKKDHFVPKVIHNAEEMLALVLEERRKELIFRGTRWADLKRLNKDSRFAKTLYRKVPGYNETYTLPPNDLRYVFLIPETVIEMTGMQQNPR